MQLTATQKRIEFELIRALAIACVVYIHTSSVIVNNLHQVDQTSWFFLTFLDALVRWCVPVFIMVSGSLLLRKSEPYLYFFKRRLGRIGLPLLIWLPLYWLAVSVFQSPLPGPKELFQAVVYEQPYVHLYFLFVMLQLAILTPWLRSVVRTLTRRSFMLLIAIFIYIGMAYQLKTTFVFYLFVPYLGYYLYGFFAKDLTLKTRRNKLIGLSTVALSAALLVVAQYFMIQGQLTIPGIAKPTELVVYLSPLVVLMSLLVFPLLNDPAVVRRISRVVSPKIITSLGECSFGIYLIHPILQLALGHFFPDLYQTQLNHAVPMTLGLSIGFFITSWGIAWILRQIRWTKMLV